MAELSDCCGAQLRVEGRTTQYYVCTSCGKACDRAVSDLHAEILEGLEAAGRGETEDLGSFAEYAGD